jgi:hypothetical protein
MSRDWRHLSPRSSTYPARSVRAPSLPHHATTRDFRACYPSLPLFPSGQNPSPFAGVRCTRPTVQASPSRRGLPDATFECSGDKPYSCDTYDKAFSTSGHLTTRLRPRAVAHDPWPGHVAGVFNTQAWRCGRCFQHTAHSPDAVLSSGQTPGPTQRPSLLTQTPGPTQRPSLLTQTRLATRPSPLLPPLPCRRAPAAQLGEGVLYAARENPGAGVGAPPDGAPPWPHSEGDAGPAEAAPPVPPVPAEPSERSAVRALPASLGVPLRAACPISTG